MNWVLIRHQCNYPLLYINSNKKEGCGRMAGPLSPELNGSLGRKTVKPLREKNCEMERNVWALTLNPHNITKPKLTNDWIAKTCLSTFKQLFSHILTVKEKGSAWIMSPNSYFKQKWLEKLLRADGEGYSKQGQFYLGRLGEMGMWQKRV